MVVVYFESSSHSEQVATFTDEDTYAACLPALEAMATAERMTVTESVQEDTVHE